MTVSIRRLSSRSVAAGAERVAAVGLVGLAAATPIKKIQFTDTKLKNGLRVIISEDHAAPVVRRSPSTTTSARATSGRAAPASRISSST